MLYVWPTRDSSLSRYVQTDVYRCLSSVQLCSCAAWTECLGCETNL